MVEVNQYIVTPREMAELILKSAGVREGHWTPVVNFGFAPGNFGPTAAQLAPGVAVIAQNVGIQRLPPDQIMTIPPEIVVDAAKLASEADDKNRPAGKSGRPKTST